VINAINQMNNIIQSITHGAPQINNTRFPSEAQAPPPEYARLTWEEAGRDYADSEVVNPDDESQSIKIKVISRVFFQEKATEHQLVYEGSRG
jgi:hypothetical protein